MTPARAGTLLAWAACAAWAACSGCVALQRGGLYPLDRDEVFVAYFFNETFYRNTEFELAEQIIEEILSSPGLRLTSKESAEVVLSGRVLSVRQQVLAEDPSQAPLASNTSVTVEVVVTRARSGEVLRREIVTQGGQFIPRLGEDLQTARRETYRYLARDIVRLLEKDF